MNKIIWQKRPYSHPHEEEDYMAFDILNTFDHLYCKYQGHKNTMLYTSKQKATDMLNEIANYI